MPQIKNIRKQYLEQIWIIYVTLIIRVSNEAFRISLLVGGGEGLVSLLSYTKYPNVAIPFKIEKMVSTIVEFCSSLHQHDSIRKSRLAFLGLTENVQVI